VVERQSYTLLVGGSIPSLPTTVPWAIRGLQSMRLSGREVAGSKVPALREIGFAMLSTDWLPSRN
jgi:hypothetical protein